LVREVFCRGLRNRDDIHVVAAQPDSFDAARLTRERRDSSGIRAPNDPIDVLVLISGGSIAADMEQIVYIRAQEPALKILLLGSANEDAEFLQYVRAGISGYLWRDASAEDIAQGILNVNAGRAVCPGELCAACFDFLRTRSRGCRLGALRNVWGLRGGNSRLCR
jgi:DNA-binding NarL/FixJ family response regulator